MYIYIILTKNLLLEPERKAKSNRFHKHTSGSECSQNAWFHLYIPEILYFSDCSSVDGKFYNVNYPKKKYCRGSIVQRNLELIPVSFPSLPFRWERSAMRPRTVASTCSGWMTRGWWTRQWRVAWLATWTTRVGPIATQRPLRWREISKFSSSPTGKFSEGKRYALIDDNTL